MDFQYFVDEFTRLKICFAPAPGIIGNRPNKAIAVANFSLPVPLTPGTLGLLRHLRSRFGRRGLLIIIVIFGMDDTIAEDSRRRDQSAWLLPDVPGLQQ